MHAAYCYTSLSDCGPPFRRSTDPNPKPSIALTLLTLNLTLLTLAVTLTLNFGIADFRNGAPSEWRASTIGRSVGRSDSPEPYKTAKTIAMPFGLWVQIGSVNHIRWASRYLHRKEQLWETSGGPLCSIRTLCREPCKNG